MINPHEWDSLDGFSPMPSIQTYLPGVSLAASGMATWKNISLSQAPDHPVVIFDTATRSVSRPCTDPRTHIHIDAITSHSTISCLPPP